MYLKHKAIKEQLKIKDIQLDLLKFFLKQREENEKEVFADKEIDPEIKDKYLEGIIHTWWTKDECEYAQKFNDTF